MKYFSKEQWFSLPLKLRVEWWKETDYNQKPPPSGLVAKLLSVATKKPVKGDWDFEEGEF